MNGYLSQLIMHHVVDRRRYWSRGGCQDKGITLFNNNWLWPMIDKKASVVTPTAIPIDLTAIPTSLCSSETCKRYLENMHHLDNNPSWSRSRNPPSSRPVTFNSLWSISCGKVRRPNWIGERLRWRYQEGGRKRGRPPEKAEWQHQVYWEDCRGDDRCARWKEIEGVSVSSSYLTQPRDAERCW